MVEAAKTLPANNYSDLEESFSDTFETHINPWSSAITFGLRATKPEENNQMTLRVRMSLEQAKALALILLRGIREYESAAGVNIELPEKLLADLNIPREDWQHFQLPGNEAA